MACMVRVHSAPRVAAFSPAGGTAMGGAQSREAFRDSDETDEALRLASRFTRNEIRTPTPSTPSELQAVD
eukprot:5030831-Prymnesium_polylepis.1